MGSAVMIALGIGVAIAIQIGTIGRAAERFDVLAISLVLQVGGVIAGLAWVSLRSGWADVAGLVRLWWWIPLGVLGWMLVGGLGFTSSRVGVAATLAVSIAAQLVVGLLVDAGAGWGIGMRGVTGLVLLVAGAMLVAGR